MARRPKSQRHLRPREPSLEVGPPQSTVDRWNAIHERFRGALSTGTNVGVALNEPSEFDLFGVLTMGWAHPDENLVLNLFEGTTSKGVPQLVSRVAAAEYVAYPEVPLFNLDELEAHTTKFLEFFRRDEARLRAAAPARSMIICPGSESDALNAGSWEAEFPWLARRFCRFHEHIDALRSMSTTPDTELPRWAVWEENRPHPHTFPWVQPAGVGAMQEERDLAARRAKWLEHQKAAANDLLAGHAGVSKVYSEQKNAAFFALRRRVLEILIRRVRSRRLTNLWPEFIEELGHHFDSDEIVSLIEDRLPEGVLAPRSPLFGMMESVLEVGPLVGLIEIVGHFEKEIAIGTLAATRAALDPVLREFPSTSIRRLPPYFEFVGTPLQDPLDRALDTYLKLEAQEADFWVTFRSRAERDLRAELPVLVVPRGFRVRRRQAQVAEPIANLLMEQLQSHIEVAPVKHGEFVYSPTQVGESRFVRDGSHWLIEFDGVVARVPHRVGMAHIARILDAPTDGVSVLVLWRKGQTELPDLIGLESLFDEMLPEREPETRRADDLADPSEGIETLDKKDLSRYRALRRECESQLQRAVARKDDTEARKLRAGIESIDAYLSKFVDKHGRPRTEASAVEQARKTVGAAVRRSYADIYDNKLPFLRSHLARSIKISRTCRYDPDPPRPWLVVLESSAGAHSR